MSQQMTFAEKVLTVVAAVVLVGSIALDVVCVYQHWSIPLHHGRGSDVWGSLLLFSAIMTFLSGTLLVAMADG